MNRLKVSILLILSLVLVTGCSNKSKSSSEASFQETKSKSDIKKITSDEFKTKIKDLKRAVILIGDPKDQNYQKNLDKLFPVCNEAKVQLYTLNFPKKKLVDEYNFNEKSDVILVRDGKIGRAVLGGGEEWSKKRIDQLFNIEDIFN